MFDISVNLERASAIGNFFDRSPIVRMLDKQTRRVFSRFGAFVRRRARSSIRQPRQKSLSDLTPQELVWYERELRLYRQGKRATKPRRPNAPSRPGEPPRSQLGLLRDNIFFSYDPQEQAVVIGPTLLSAHAGAQALKALEFSGTSEIRRGKKAKIAARPFMGPAFEKELPGVMNIWSSVAS